MPPAQIIGPEEHFNHFNHVSSFASAIVASSFTVSYKQSITLMITQLNNTNWSWAHYTEKVWGCRGLEETTETTEIFVWTVIIIDGNGFILRVKISEYWGLHLWSWFCFVTKRHLPCLNCLPESLNILLVRVWCIWCIYFSIKTCTVHVRVCVNSLCREEGW